MELDDLKNAWNATNSAVAKQEPMTPETVKKMNDQKYRSRIKKIIIPEIAGSVICLAGAVFIAFNFYDLNKIFLQGAGILSIVLLLLLPTISMLSTWKLGTARSLDRPYAETLKEFARQKIRFVRLQKLNVTLSYLLLVTIIILLSKLLEGNDLSANKSFWIFSFSTGYIFLLFYSRWVEKYYKTTLRQAEELLSDLAA
jgi:hypothetical protein